MIRTLGPKMSKSKGNLVAPEEYYENVGADGLRLFHLFGRTTGRDIDWTDQTDEVHRRLRAILGPGLSTQSVPTRSLPRRRRRQRRRGSARRSPHDRKKVTDDLEHWGHNTAVAALMELVNTGLEVGRSDHGAGSAQRFDESIDVLVMLLSPMAPHVTAEIWELRHPR